MEHWVSIHSKQQQASSGSGFWNFSQYQCFPKWMLLKELVCGLLISVHWKGFFPLKAQKPFQERRQKDHESPRSRNIRPKQCLLDMKGLLHSWTHSSWGCLHKIKPVNVLLGRVKEPSHLRQLMASWGKRVSFFKDMALVNGPQPEVCGKCRLEPVG